MTSSFNSRRPSAPLLISFIALFAALSGSALALSKGEVRSKHIAKNAVKSKHVAKNTVKTPKIADGSVTAAKLAPGVAVGGEQGPAGLKGDTGATGPSTGPAGGHLSGIYPNPQISPSAPLWRKGGNSGTDATDFLGTTDDQPLDLRVNNRRALRLEPRLDGSAPAPNVIAGSPDNAVVGATVHSATISGGGWRDPGDAGSAHKVTDDGGTVGGGRGNTAALNSTVAGGADNTASGLRATVAGGESNTASGLSWATVGGGSGNTAGGSWATVAGGANNAASAPAWASVGGGVGNTASANGATVAGGESNTAAGAWATVAGGWSNTAAGNHSVAAGRRAKANHQGTFVWADATNADVASTAANQFTARAVGGVRFFSSAGGAGVQLAPGAGAWSALSDEATKRDIEPVSGREVLRKLSEVPVSEWSYESQEDGIRHIGPMAQDFYDAFGVGEDRRRISTVDADGVALAAIKGLQEENEELKQTVAEQDEELRERVDALEAQLAGTATAGPGGLPGTPILAGLGIALLVALGGFAALRGRPARWSANS